MNLIIANFSRYIYSYASDLAMLNLQMAAPITTFTQVPAHPLSLTPIIKRWGLFAESRSAQSSRSSSTKLNVDGNLYPFMTSNFIEDLQKWVQKLPYYSKIRKSKQYTKKLDVSLLNLLVFNYRPSNNLVVMSFFHLALCQKS